MSRNYHAQLAEDAIRYVDDPAFAAAFDTSRIASRRDQCLPEDLKYAEDIIFEAAVAAVHVARIHDRVPRYGS